jgi:hypothetical protein
VIGFSDKQIWDLFVVMDQEWALARDNIKGRKDVIGAARKFIEENMSEFVINNEEIAP